MPQRDAKPSFEKGFFRQLQAAFLLNLSTSLLPRLVAMLYVLYILSLCQPFPCSTRIVPHKSYNKEKGPSAFSRRPLLTL